MPPPYRTSCHISKIPSEIRQLITSNLSGKSTLKAESIELDSAPRFRLSRCPCRFLKIPESRLPPPR